MDRFKAIIERAMKLKKVMLKKGLKRAKAKCPEEGCSGHLNGILAPNRRSKDGYHIHMRCDGTCNTVFME